MHHPAHEAHLSSARSTAPVLPLWLSALLLGLLALLPRTLALADFFTVDESFHWVWRVQHFTGALRQENWAGTNLTGHPGITTLWLGSLGRWLALHWGVPTGGLAEGSAGIAYLALLRLPLALVNSAAVVVGFLLLRRLVRPPVALLAGLLWAGSPFLIAHSRLLHLDALLTSFMMLCVLCVLVAAHAPTARAHWLALLGAGVCGGLALLTKAPSLLLLPLVGLLLLLLSPPGGLVGRARWAAARYGAWLALALALAWALWPALWVQPQQAIWAVLAEIRDNGAVPHHTGNYFLGAPVADPGPLFYLAVVAWRSAPLILPGLVGLLVALHPSARLPAVERRTLLALLLYAGLFALALTLAAKKFDRYLLPAFPALAVLAAAGLVALWQVVQAQGRLPGWLARGLLPGLALLSALGMNWWYHPAYLAYFNPLLGGPPVAERVLLVGWGEGMEQVGDWLQERPDVARSPVLTWDPRTLEPFVPGRVTFLNEHTVHEPASYAVLYVRSVQRNESGAAQDYVRTVPPLHTLHMHGVEYASVHQPPRPFTTPVDAVFGDGLHLRGYSQALISTTLVLTPSWNVQADQPGNWFSFVHVLDAQGQRVAQLDVPIDEGLFESWQRGQQFGSPLPIALPPGLPAGRYQVVLGVYQPETFARMPLTTGTPQPETLAGAHVIELLTLDYAGQPGGG